MILPPLLACFITAKDIIIPIGWLASSMLGFWFACHLDRRRSINGVRSQIEMIRDLVESSEDGETSYKATFDDLKKAVFTSIPLFSKSRQKEIIQAWVDYRSLDFRVMSDTNFDSVLLESVGENVTFKHKAVLAALGEIERHIK